MATLGLLICCLLLTITTASHMQGGSMSFRYKGRNSNGTLQVHFRYKESFSGLCHEEFYWPCYSGNCGNIKKKSYYEIDRESTGTWCQAEGIMEGAVYDQPFSLRESSCCWVFSNGFSSWSLLTYVDLGTRSDTGQPNSSPVTAMIPVIRVPKNCASSYKLVAADPDDDTVNCRYGQKDECATCSQHASFSFDQSTCTLSYLGTATAGAYIMEIVLEDFPKHQITLSYSNGKTAVKAPLSSRSKRSVLGFSTLQPTTQSSRWSSVQSSAALLGWPPITLSTSKPQVSTTTTTTTPTTSYSSANSNALSKIPLQFIVEVDTPISSCIYGDLRPKFLPPTPSNGAIFTVKVGTKFQLKLAATATMDRMASFKISGPSYINITYRYDYYNQTGISTLEWTPTASDLGDHLPICFVAETINRYQSQLRCVVIIVGVTGSRSLTPIRGEASINCTDNAMTIAVLKSSIKGVQENHLRLNDPSCPLTANGSHVIATVPLNSCGTQVEENEKDIIFRNEITSFDHPKDVITRKHLVQIPFSCSYPKQSNVSSEWHAQKGAYIFEETGFGKFYYVFEFYDSSDYSRRIDPSFYPLEVKLQDRLFMEIRAETMLNNVQMFVDSCRATAHDNPNDSLFYDIIHNGCLQDDTLLIYPSNKTEFRFGLDAFAFIGNYEEVYMTCGLIICKVDDPNTRCARGCLNSNNSAHNIYRRSASLESELHFVTRGPLHLAKRSARIIEDHSVSSSSNLHLFLTALGFIAVIAVLATLIIYKKKPSSIKEYHLLPLDEY